MIYELKNDNGFKAASNRLEFLRQVEKTVEIKIVRKTRTTKQNAALHKYFTLVADFLNNKGITYEVVLGLEAPFTPEIIKYSFFHPIMFAMFDLKSTTKLTTAQMNQVFDVYSKHLSEMTGEYIAFPSIENL